MITTPADGSVLRFVDAALGFGRRTLWTGLTFALAPGELVAVLGGNGAGKTSLVRTILGQQPLTGGRVEVLGGPVRRGDRRIGYVPQQAGVADTSPVRGEDFVAFGLTGHRFGWSWHRRADRRRIADALDRAGATDLAKRSLSVVSGGEHQRLRVAQALVGRPRLLLCDEPVTGLDLARQRDIVGLIGQAKIDTGCGVLMITHDINPVLHLVDRVIYLAAGRATVGTVDEVFTTAGMSRLYGTHVDVIRTHGRIVVVGAGPTSPPINPTPAAAGVH